MGHQKLSRRFLGAAMAVVLSSCLVTLGMGQSAYHIGEGTERQDQSVTADPGDGSDNNQSSAPSNPETSGPVRMARFSFLSGSVTWRPDPSTEWANASLNMPLREGSEVWVGDGGRAELQFDDGSVIRFGSGAVANLQTLFSDSQGEFTEIKLTDGLASMDLRTDHSIYQIDTPKGAIKSTGPSLVRVGVDDDVEIGIRDGSATLDGVGGKVTLQRGDYLDVAADATTYKVEPIPDEDTWDKFTDERHALLSHDDPNLPQNLKFIGGDLDQYGGWQNDSDYGQVWVPHETSDWTPYHDGHWVWCEPFGWTWVGAEPWGWAPYHYGSWVHRRYGWGWVPGPVAQYWSPGVVDFAEADGNVCWTPLAPFECHYPVGVSLGVWGGGWSTYFSIGYCGAWFPFGNDFCRERVWNSNWVNGWHPGYTGGLGGYFGHHIGGNPNPGGYHFHPVNAGFATVTASRETFGSGGAFNRLTGHNGQSVFERGQSFTAPRRGSGFTAGPSNVRPTASSWSASKSFTTRPENTGILNRQVFRGTSTAPGRTVQSGADAARAARQSLGWTGGSYSGSAARGGQPTTGFGAGNNGGYNRGAGSFGGNRGTTTGGTTRSTTVRPRSNWSIPDRGGWSHVHSNAPASHPSSGGSRGGGGGRGH